MPNALDIRSQTKLKFGRWVLDRRRMEVSDGDEVVRLQPIVYALLEHFLTNPGRVIGKDELLESVWKTPFVTDSVVARAVMKLRKSVGQLVTTVHGVGYRFEGTVEEVRPPDRKPSAPRGPARTALPAPVAVLRFADERRLEPVPAAVDGLTGWLHFACEQSGLGPLLPMSSVHAWNPGGSQPLDIVAACSSLGAASAIACRLSEEAGRTVVDASWGDAGGGTLQSRRFVGLDAPDAIVQLLRALVVEVPAFLADSAWTESLIEVFMLERQGREQQALERLAALPREALEKGSLLLMHVRLLRKQGRLEPATAVAHKALATASSALSPATHARLLAELSELSILRADYGEASSLCEQAMALIESEPDSGGALSDVLLAMARVAFPTGDAPAGIQLSGRALDAAMAEGDHASAISTRLWLANMLVADGRHSEAIHHAHQAVKAAAAYDMPALQASGYNVLGSIHGMRREHTTAVDFARKSLAFCSGGGDHLMVLRASLTEFTNLISASRLSEAALAFARLPSTPLMPEQPARFFSVYAAKLAWRQGRHEQAVAALDDLLRQFTSLGNAYRWDVGAELFQCLLSLRRRDAAMDVLDRCADDPQEWRRLSREADLALYDGDRERCMSLLRKIWFRFATGGPYMIDSALNLAWLLLEEGQIDGQRAFWQHVRSITPEHECARLVHHRYRITASPESFDPEAWRREVLSIPGLASRNQWLADVEQATPAAPRARRALPELVSQACW